MSATDVLIVEDDEASRELLERRLVRQGLTVATASSADEAVGFVRSEQPGLVLLDLSLGSDGGESVIATLKGDAATWTVPIIVLSGHGGARRQRAWEAGCDDYLTKPVDFDTLLGKVRSLLP